MLDLILRQRNLVRLRIYMTQCPGPLHLCCEVICNLRMQVMRRMLALNYSIRLAGQQVQILWPLSETFEFLSEILTI